MIDAHSFRQCFFVTAFIYFCTLREFLGIGVCHDTRAKITGLSKIDSDTLTETLLLKYYILKPYY